MSCAASRSPVHRPTASSRNTLRFVSMRGITEKTTIHIGPGIFETQGLAEGQNPPPGFRVQSGQRILGAGMGLTTLKLVAAYAPTGGRNAAVIRTDNFL